MTFTIYADRLPEVTKRLECLAKKAARYSVPFAYRVGDEHPQAARIYAIDHATSTQYVLREFTVAAIDIEIDCEDLIKANGWMLRAKCEHGDKGNIVSSIGSKPIDEAWFKAPARCEHCNTNRFRSITYFVENENGTVRQVGRSCLREYTGINPALAALWAEVRDIESDNFDMPESVWATRKGCEMYAVADVLAHAYDAIKGFGYRKSEEPDSTRNEVMKRLAERRDASAEGQAQAERIKTWLLDLDASYEDLRVKQVAAWDGIENAETERDADAFRKTYWSLERKMPSDLERNCIAMLRAGYVKPNHIGRLAYTPVAYEKALERKAKDEAREAAAQAEAHASEHVGTIGQRLTVKTATAKLLTSWEGDFGMTFLYKFTDESGNVFIWYASRAIDVTDGMILKGTVKNHNERDGVKQTVLTRCKAA